MNLTGGIHQIVRFKNGDVWHFFHKRNRGIYFRQLGTNGLWEKPIELIIGIVEDFSVNIDNMDFLHLICRAKTGELIYMKFDGKVWSRQILSRFEPLRYTVKYPNIIIKDNHIHILFVLGTTFNTGYWTLYHYHWDEKNWSFTEITRFTAGPYLSPFNIEVTDNHIHVVYRGLHAKKFQIFHLRFNIDHGIWSIPENVTHSEEDCNMPSMLIMEDQLHLAWVSLDKNDLTIKYKKKSMASSNGWTEEALISEVGANSTLPYFLYTEGKLWCIWNQSSALFGSFSMDNGDTWSPCQPIDFIKNIEYCVANYRTNYPDDLRLFRLNKSLCSLDVSLRLPLLQKLLGLPEYNPTIVPEPWRSQERDEDGNIEAAKVPDEENSDNKDADNKSQSTSQKTFGHLPSQARRHYNLQTFEQFILKEMERFEEHSYSILSKLEDNHNDQEQSLKVLKELISKNTEMLYYLTKEIEQIKDELSKKGLFKRLFST